MPVARLVAVFLLFSLPLVVAAEDSSPFSQRNSLALFADYSNTSSHILLGVARERRLASFGLTYSRRLLHTRRVDWHYDLEVLPLTFIQNPTSQVTFMEVGPTPVTSPIFSGSVPLLSACTSSRYQLAPVPTFNLPAIDITQLCATRWTYAGGLSPLGQRVNFGPRHRVQPFTVGNAGFLVSPRDIPVDNSSRFNLTFEFGAGLQLFQSRGRSWSLDYRLHHISNAHIGNDNPGIDNQIVRLTYSFGR